MPAGAPPATPTLASASSIRCQPHCQSSRTTRSPRVHPDALTFAIRQTDRSDPRRPTSSSHAPWLNPHSACGSAGAPPTAISCLGAFWTPAASVGGGARHRRRPKTCTIPERAWRQSITSRPASPSADSARSVETCRLRHLRQDWLVREVFRWPPFAGSGCVWRARTQPGLGLILKRLPIAQSERPAGDGMIDAHPSRGRRLFVSLHDHARVCFYALANGGITVEDERLICGLDSRTGGPRSQCQVLGLGERARRPQHEGDSKHADDRGGH